MPRTKWGKNCRQHIVPEARTSGGLTDVVYCQIFVTGDMNKSDDETKVSQLVRLNQDNEAL